ncbi:MAG TPA: glycosyltransferase 61 family protein [Paracoccus sp. (in: a-proteobacteria)]|nr:glycosyltransferase 61 family protein [Paracoccus sp. (in: a-proteobacteria)]
MSEPLPDEGWSRRIVIVRDALVCPPAGPGYFQKCGILGPDGDCLHGANWREGERLTMAVTRRPKPARRLSGRHLWGGMYYGHFGHFLTETLSRLWGLKGSGAESVLFLPKHGALPGFSGYRADACRLFGVDVPVSVVDQPIEVEELIVPGQGFGLGKISRGTPEFRAMLRELSHRITAQGPERIYISRTRFGGKGGIIDEAALERNMVAQGYSVIYPEKMPLEKQLAHYKAATHVVGLDSSAFHVFGFVARPDQRAAIILRRNAHAWQHIAWQLEAVMEQPPLVIQALLADWLPERQNSANHLSWGELDFRAVAGKLAEGGFISDPSFWELADETGFATAVAAAEQVNRGPLIRCPAPEFIQAH